MAEHDLTWRNILLLCGSTIAVSCSVTFYVMRTIHDSFQTETDRRLGGIQRQIDQIHDRLNAPLRDLEEAEPGK